MSREENEVQGAKQNVVAVDSNDMEQRVVDRLEAHTGCLLYTSPSPRDS